MASDAVVIPYVDIFQSGVPFLAFSFGLPVIATDVGSLREDVTSETGLLCRPRDAGRPGARHHRLLPERPPAESRASGDAHPPVRGGAALVGDGERANQGRLCKACAWSGPSRFWCARRRSTRARSAVEMPGIVGIISREPAAAVSQPVGCDGEEHAARAALPIRDVRGAGDGRLRWLGGAPGLVCGDGVRER